MKSAVDNRRDEAHKLWSQASNIISLVLFLVLVLISDIHIHRCCCRCCLIVCLEVYKT